MESAAAVCVIARVKLLPSVLFSIWLGVGALHADQFGPLAPAPDWSRLEAFQETITSQDFVRLLANVYAPKGAARDWITVKDNFALIRTSDDPDAPLFTLRFAASSKVARQVPRFWRPATALPPPPEGRPLADVRIALDPGHIGGEWARMEERWFQIGDAPPIKEGEMTLTVARLLAPRLEALGAEVRFVRDTLEPASGLKPPDFERAAVEELRRRGITHPRRTYSSPNDPGKGDTIQWESERLFYRVAEIRRRAQLVNQKLKPDLVVCIHFNAEAWGDPASPTLVPKNHFHVLVNGAYSAAELAYGDVRFDMLIKLLSRSYPEELAVAGRVATVMGERLHLPPYEYTTPNVLKVGRSPFIWARNLIANRLFQCPVVYLEPYVMNSREVFDRIQAGEYEGDRSVAGALRPSIFREYADAVAAGLADYFRQARKPRS